MIENGFDDILRAVVEYNNFWAREEGKEAALLLNANEERIRSTQDDEISFMARISVQMCFNGIE